MSGSSTTASRVTLLTRKPCQLCEPVRDVVQQVCSDAGVAWQEINVDTDPELADEYGDLIPVVLVDGEVVATHHLQADALAQALAHAE